MEADKPGPTNETKCIHCGARVLVGRIANSGIILLDPAPECYGLFADKMINDVVRTTLSMVAHSYVCKRKI